MRYPNFFGLALLVVVFSFARVTQTIAQDQLKYRLIAVYMYNFTKYINWQKTGDEFIVGFLGESPVVPQLKPLLQGKNVGNIPANIIQINSGADAAKCHIVYLTYEKSALLPEVIAAAEGNNVLIVTEKDLTKDGASISFVVIDSKLKYKIRKANIDDAGLQVKMELLKLGIAE